MAAPLHPPGLVSTGVFADAASAPHAPPALSSALGLDAPAADDELALEEELRAARRALADEQIAAKLEVAAQRKEAARLRARVEQLEKRRVDADRAVRAPLRRLVLALRTRARVAGAQAAAAEAAAECEAQRGASARQQLQVLRRALRHREAREEALQREHERAVLELAATGDREREEGLEGLMEEAHAATAAREAWWQGELLRERKAQEARLAALRAELEPGGGSGGSGGGGGGGAPLGEAAERQLRAARASLQAEREAREELEQRLRGLAPLQRSAAHERRARTRRGGDGDGGIGGSSLGVDGGGGGGGGGTATTAAAAAAQGRLLAALVAEGWGVKRERGGRLVACALADEERSMLAGVAANSSAAAAAHRASAADACGAAEAAELADLRAEARALWTALDIPAQRVRHFLLGATEPAAVLPPTAEALELYEAECAERASDCHVLELSHRVEQLEARWQAQLAGGGGGGGSSRAGGAAFEELAAARTQLRAEIAAHREQFGEGELRRLARGVGDSSSGPSA